LRCRGPEHLQAIESAQTDELDAWLDRIIDAPTIKAVFGQIAH
jgi:hypothetical protein